MRGPGCPRPLEMTPLVFPLAGTPKICPDTTGVSRPLTKGLLRGPWKQPPPRVQGGEEGLLLSVSVQESSSWAGAPGELLTGVMTGRSG